ncbi:hypothetical protein PV08_03878 [Exophiala spinifera]|uniref:Transcription factor domain-containing protein n=1 Tax=Exophiala spinifera TaxID=91928 RepID=A0A0D2BDI9_9EURO|nr:uncharacterized protein PV08_03878 [Exophiala spinifera]KIW16690.1 hypothetical protein PV08_03878 [Exophiala spinifera]
MREITAVVYATTVEASQANGRANRRARLNRSQASIPKSQSSGSSTAVRDSTISDGPAIEPLVSLDVAEGDLLPWLDFDLDGIDQFDLSVTPSLPQAEGQFAQSGDVVPLASSQSHSQYRTRSVVGCALRSPTHLLNAKSNATILDDHLSQIYETITLGAGSVFLDYNCNMYTGRYRYELEENIPCSDAKYSASVLDFLNNGLPDLELHSKGPELASTPCRGTSLLQIQTPLTTFASQRLPLVSTTRRMRVMGAFRFLDHFSDLWGVPLSSADQKKSDEVLKAVLRAFSFQWLSSSDTKVAFGALFSTPAGRMQQEPGDFVDAWHNARSLINDSRSIYSFRVVYAALLFDTIDVPQEIRGSPDNNGFENEFLDSGLDKLLALEAPLRRYCTTLGPFSEYSGLLEASLNIALWFGYLRDTVASLLTRRSCRMLDIPRQRKFSLSQTDIFNVEGGIPDMCREALANATYVWRQIGRFQNEVSNSIDAIPSISSVFAAIEGYEATYHILLDFPLESIAHLPVGSTKFWSVYKFTVGLMFFWYLGVLVVTHTVQSVTANNESMDQQFGCKLRHYQLKAISALTRTVECVSTLPTPGSWKPDSGLSADIPITACHISPGMA